MHKTTKNSLAPSKRKGRDRGHKQKRERGGKKCKKKKRRFVFQIFRCICDTFFSSSLFASLAFVGRFLSSRTKRISHLPSDRLPRARCALLGFQTRERERKREGIKVVLRSSTLIIIIIIKYDQTRHQRRIQVAEIRSEEHQIGLVPEKLLPMHETGLSSQEASGKRTREVRKPAQSRETELVIAQSAEKQVTAAERYHRHTQQGGKEEE